MSGAVRGVLGVRPACSGCDRRPASGAEPPGSAVVAADERLYIVAYDIASPKRWRGVFTLMHGYGEHLQLSVFQCRLTRVRYAELVAEMGDLIHHKEDHVVIVDVGDADHVEPKVVSLGKKPYAAVKREPIIV